MVVWDVIIIIEILEEEVVIMMKGGVERAPDIWFTEDIEQTEY